MKELPKSKQVFNKRILTGLKQAYNKLVEETAARNGTLVVERDGKVVHVPAKELLNA
ncbi:MAG: hypothetical protein QM642_01055 [Edaphocola sp.]